ncbi:MAG: lipoyl(octanoyl) transferase LipB [Chloroflexi bacterium]|nr:lipoyl(octanoyl) transferase LipB [Chloroflexota bacterium]
MNTCLVVPLGLVDFQTAYDLQRLLHARVVAGELPDLLLLLEHPHVYTLGRRGQESDVLASKDMLSRLGVDTQLADRGGETTYHGPGQLVGYPIVNLRRLGVGVRQYVETLEQVLIRALSEFGIAAHSEGKPTGVWVGDSKIAAIGVRVSRGVTMHGFALNVSPDLSFFEHIVPCGMPGVSVTSMSQELGSDVAVSDVMPALAREFASEFGVAVEWSGLDALASAAATITT